MPFVLATNPSFAALVRRFAFLLLGVALAMFSVPVSAQTRLSPEVQAREHFRLGNAAYERGEFAEAARHFESAYGLSHRPELLYNLYLSYRDSNDPERAADALRRYLSSSAAVENREELEARLHVLEDTAAARTANAAAPNVETPSSLSVPQPSTAAPPQSQPPRRRRSLAGPLTLLAGGGALALASIGPGVAARHAMNDLEAACPDRMCAPQDKATANRADRLALVTDVMWIGGAAIAVTGLTWLLVSQKRDAAPRATADAACTSRGCSVLVRGSF